jgi:ABC-type transport system substrate-binding protein
MRRSLLLFLAAASLAALPARVAAVERPRYGGTLRVEMQAAARALDPAEGPERLASLVFECLVRLDERGRPQPALALSWQSSPGMRRWQFHLRPGVKFHDGSPLTPAAVVASLPASANGWTVGPISDGIVIRSDHPLPDLLSEMAAVRNSIALRAPGGALSGTGPFRVTQWEPERRAVFSANDDYWDGRPFLDSIAVQMGRSPQQQIMDLELGRADLVELSPGDVRRASQGGMKLWSSAPVTLLAIVFDPGGAADARLREALALSIDRAAIQSVLLQKQGEPAGGLLPGWLSGYAFLFRTARDTARARQLAASIPPSSAPLTLGYDSNDPLARSIAERIAVNAREAGIRPQVSPQAAKPDLRLLRARIRSVEPGAALAGLASSLGLGELAALSDPASPEACYAAERALVEDFRVIPLVHLPEIYASRPAVRTWQTPGLLKTGEWHFEDVWLAPERP